MGLGPCILSATETFSFIYSYVNAFFLFHFQGGLFVHDIFWVFFAPVMVSVAKSFDAPIKVGALSYWTWSLLIPLSVSSIFSSWCFSWSGFAWLCTASVSNCRCCTAILHAWPWWHCNTWLVIKISLLVLCYILLCCDTDFNPYWMVISASVGVSSANFVLHD